MKQKQLRIKIYKRLKDILVSSYDNGTVENGGILNGLECSKQIELFIKENCFGILMSTGSWDDYSCWTEFVVFNDTEAIEFVENYNNKLRKLQNKLRETLPKDEFGNIDFDNIPNAYRYQRIFDRNEARIVRLKLL